MWSTQSIRRGMNKPAGIWHFTIESTAGIRLSRERILDSTQAATAKKIAGIPIYQVDADASADAADFPAWALGNNRTAKKPHWWTRPFPAMAPPGGVSQGISDGTRKYFLINLTYIAFFGTNREIHGSHLPSCSRNRPVAKVSDAHSP